MISVEAYMNLRDERERLSQGLIRATRKIVSLRSEHEKVSSNLARATQRIVDLEAAIRAILPAAVAGQYEEDWCDGVHANSWQAAVEKAEALLLDVKEDKA